MNFAEFNNRILFLKKLFRILTMTIFLTTILVKTNVISLMTHHDMSYL